MKKLVCMMIAAAFLLCGCSEKTPPQDFCNTAYGCYLGDTHYQETYGFGDMLIWNPAWEEALSGLCRDPLCMHQDRDALCPSSVYLMVFKTIATDGYKLYLSVLNDLLYKDGNQYRQIYSLNPDGSEFELLHTYSATSNLSPRLHYADGYLYFAEGFYRANTDSQSTQSAYNDQYIRFMRIPVGGGDAEAVLDAEFDIGYGFNTDGTNYYLTYIDEQGNSQFEVIDAKTKEVIQTLSGLYSVQVYQGKTWLYSDEGLFVYEKQELKQVSAHNGTYSFGGGIWYTEEAEPVYIGTKDMPTGGPLGETSPVEYYVEATTKLCRIDPDDYTVTEFVPSDDFDAEDRITVEYTSDAGIRASVYNSRKEFDEVGGMYQCLIRCENGTITIEKVYE